MLFSIIYNIGLLLFAIVSLPKIFYEMIVHGKYRKSFWSRLGLSTSFPIKDKTTLIWIHAVSVGETKAIAPLVQSLKARMPDATLVISSGTETGSLEAKRCMPFADHYLILPLDFSWIMRKIMAGAKPDFVILCETDFYYHFLYYAKKNGAKLGVVNGKISLKSMERLQKVHWFSDRIFSLFDFLCVQNPLYLERFKKLGISENKLTITGNLKFDAEYPPLSKDEFDRWQSLLGIKNGDEVLVIGSTHNSEEELIYEILKKIWLKHQNLKVIIAPRHPERFKEVFSLFENEKIPFSRLTQLQTNKESIPASLIIVDTVGMLRICYQFATVSIVGGSFVTHVGGHNILEPCAYGIPVIFGPHMHSQPELTEQVLLHKAGVQVPLQELEQAIENLLNNPELRYQMGQNGKQLMEGNKGAVQRSLDVIFMKEKQSFT